MGKKYLFNFVITSLFMILLILFKEKLNLVLYLAMVILPIIIVGIYLKKHLKKEQNEPIYKVALINSVIYVVAFAIFSIIMAKLGIYQNIVDNSTSILGENVIGEVGNTSISDYILPFVFAFIVYYIFAYFGKEREV